MIRKGKTENLAKLDVHAFFICNAFLKSAFPVDIGRKLNVHKTFRRRPGRLLNVLCTFNLRPVSTGLVLLNVFMN